MVQPYPGTVEWHHGNLTKWPTLKTVKQGSKGPTVLRLQRYLAINVIDSKSVFPYKPTGVFGPKTAASVRKYQRARKLRPDGIVGPGTWAQLQHDYRYLSTPTLKDGQRSTRVLSLQRKLRKLGYFPYTPTGVFGPKTKTCVKRYQKHIGATVDGLAGPTTLGRLQHDYKAAVAPNKPAPKPPKKPKPPRKRATYFADIYSGETGVNLTTYKRSGYDTIALKGSEGATFEDSAFNSRWKTAGKLGLDRIYYHYARPENNTPEAEARNVLRVAKRAGGFKKTDRIALDWEAPKFENRNGDNWTKKFWSEITRLTGVPAKRQWIYSYGPYAASTLTTTHGRGYWHAAYNSHPTANVPGFAKKYLVAVQFTDGQNGSTPHSLPGCSSNGHCDVSRWA